MCTLAAGLTESLPDHSGRQRTRDAQGHTQVVESGEQSKLGRCASLLQCLGERVPLAGGGHADRSRTVNCGVSTRPEGELVALLAEV